MRRSALSVAVVLICAAALVPAQAGQQAKAVAPKGKVRVLITSGGHPFDPKGFFAMWDSFAGIAWREGKISKETADVFTAENLKECDVLVTFDMAQNITDEQKQAFLDFIKRGGGLVVLHHSLASWQNWPDYERIIGGRFLLTSATREGKLIPRGAAKHGLELNIHVANRNHPITQGMEDFVIPDEAYKGYIVNPDVRVLLTTDNPNNNTEVAWVRREGKAPIAMIQLGHDNKAWSNPNYRKLVERAVMWAAGRLARPQAGAKKKK